MQYPLIYPVIDYWTFLENLRHTVHMNMISAEYYSGSGMDSDTRIMMSDLRSESGDRILRSNVIRDSTASKINMRIRPKLIR